MRRGGQPWYYYFVISSIYEFLPLFLAVAATIYYLGKGRAFELFLVYWALLTFFAYSIAGEKMPWLLVNVALPLIVLGGKFTGDLVERVDWRVAVERGGLLLVAAVPLLLYLAARLLLFPSMNLKFAAMNTQAIANVLGFGTGVVVALALVAGIVYLTRRVGLGSALGIGGLAVSLLLLGFSFRAGWRAAYVNGDVPVEMLVYTQTSPDIPRLVRSIERLAGETGKGKDLPIVVDDGNPHGFTWPWAWYLRDYKSVTYTNLSSASTVPEGAVVLSSAYSGFGAERLTEEYGLGQRYPHRWWFPENYRDLTLQKFLHGLRDRGSLRRALDYFIYRKLGEPLGAIDAIAYLPKLR